MALAFVFETSSEEEHDDFHPQVEEEEEEAAEAEDKDEDEEEQPLTKKTKSPWDFVVDIIFFIEKYNCWG